MRSTYVAPTTGLAARRVAFGLTAVVVALAIGLTLASWTVGRAGQGTDSTRAAVRVNHGYGAGYPAHGGLAGPSEQGSARPDTAYGAGYPPHGGLAGPSQVRSGAQHPCCRPGYPSHGGLAGPSRAGSKP